MSIARSPVGSAEDWDRVRDEWVADLDALYREVEAWASAQGWATSRRPVMIEGDAGGPYPASRLMIRAPEGRLEFKPIARHVMAATGLIDLRVVPRRDATRMLVRHDDGRWLIHPFGDSEISTPWTEADFVDVARQMFTSTPAT